MNKFLDLYLKHKFYESEEISNGLSYILAKVNSNAEDVKGLKGEISALLAEVTEIKTKIERSAKIIKVELNMIIRV